MIPSVISCANLEVWVNYKPLLKNINLELMPKAKCVFVGSNGIGKTTLLKTLAGVIRPHSGEINLLNSTTRKNKICYLASDPAFFLDLNAKENLSLFALSYGAVFNDELLIKVLTKVGLSKKRKEAARTYSSGQKKRLTLASLILIQPQILFIDEPTNGLDESGFHMCLEILEILRESGCVIVAASHDERFIGWFDQKINLENFVPVAASIKQVGQFK